MRCDTQLTLTKRARPTPKDVSHMDPLPASKVVSIICNCKLKFAHIILFMFKSSSEKVLLTMSLKKNLH